jgi:ribonuclease HI
MQTRYWEKIGYVAVKLDMSKPYDRDVAVDMKNGKLGYGCVIRDSGGNFQAASCHVEFLMADPVVGEALAVLHTVEFCRDNGFSSIVLEGDSLLVVQAINNTGVNWSRIGFIIDDIRNILKGFQWWKICHTK